MSNKFALNRRKKTRDYEKLKLFPNYNKSYFNWLQSLDRNNFNNPLLKTFKVENTKDAECPEELMDGDEYVKIGNQLERAPEGENDNEKILKICIKKTRLYI